MRGNAKRLECRIMLEGNCERPAGLVTEMLLEHEYDIIQKNIEWDNFQNVRKIEIEAYESIHDRG